jgi:hypothetical protein
MVEQPNKDANHENFWTYFVTIIGISALLIEFFTGIVQIAAVFKVRGFLKRERI